MSYFKLSYGASKAALDQLTVLLATLFASTGLPIRVNGIAPGVFPSQMNADYIEDIATQIAPGLVGPIPAQRVGEYVDFSVVDIRADSVT